MEVLVTVMYLDTEVVGGKTYPSEVLVPAVEYLERRIQRNEVVLGECSAPRIDGMTDGEISSRIFSIDLHRVSHAIKSVWIDGNEVRAKLSLVGKYAELAKAGWTPSVIPRALGDFNEAMVATKYTLITLDLAYQESTTD